MIDAMKQRLVQSHAERVRRIEAGDIPVIGVNRFTETADSPLVAGLDEESTSSWWTRRPSRNSSSTSRRWRARATRDAVARALDDAPRHGASTTENLVPATIALARAGGTVGEWAGALREVFGEYRAPTGVGGVHAPIGAEHARGARARPGDARASSGIRSASSSASPGSTATRTARSRSRWPRATRAWRSSTRASGSRPEQIAAAARDEDVDLVGLSVLSGSHRRLVPETVRLLREAGVDAPVVVGGIIPEADQAELVAAGVGARLHTEGLPPHRDRRRARRPRRRSERGTVTDPTVSARLPLGHRGVRVARGRRGRRRHRRGGARRSRARTGRRRRRRRRCRSWAQRSTCAGRMPSSRCWRRGADPRPAASAPGRSKPRGAGDRSPHGRADRRLGDRPGVGPHPRAPPAGRAPAGRGGGPPQGAAGVGRVLGARRSATRRRARARDQALTALAAVAWRTMRESDTVFRLGDAVALGVLVDTAEPGAR